MKSSSLAVVVAAAVTTLGVSPALAVSAGQERIDECIADTAEEGQTPDVVKKYCECMDGKMGADETATIGDWGDQAANEPHAVACEDASGWADTGEDDEGEDGDDGGEGDDGEGEGDDGEGDDGEGDDQ